MYDQSALDFGIRIRPQIEDGRWTGSVDVSIVTAENNPLPDEDFETLMILTHMVAASVPVMEMDEYIRDELNKFVVNMTEENYDDDEDFSFTNEEDNVITLAFDTKTKGNA